MEKTKVKIASNRNALQVRALFVISIFAIVGVAYLVSSFAQSKQEIITGFVTNSNGVGLANVPIVNCVNSGPTIFTDSKGYYSFSIDNEQNFCVRIQSTPDTNITATENRPEHNASPSYEYQVAGTNCYHTTYPSSCKTNEQSWDLSSEGRYSFVVKSSTATSKH